MALRHRFAIGPDIGQDHHLAAGAEGPDFGLLKRAESGAKGDLLIVVEDLVRKHQHRVTAERGTQFSGESRRRWGGAIDAVHLAGEKVMACGDLHFSPQTFGRLFGGEAARLFRQSRQTIIAERGDRREIAMGDPFGAIIFCDVIIHVAER